MVGNDKAQFSCLNQAKFLYGLGLKISKDVITRYIKLITEWILQIISESWFESRLTKIGFPESMQFQHLIKMHLQY